MFTIATGKMPPLPEPGQLSDLGINFIKQCLTLDPMMRPTAPDLINHAWMLSFRAEMMEYEQDSDMQDRSETLGGSGEQTDISRQAQLMEEMQQQEMLSP